MALVARLDQWDQDVMDAAVAGAERRKTCSCFGRGRVPARLGPVLRESLVVGLAAHKLLSRRGQLGADHRLEVRRAGALQRPADDHLAEREHGLADEPKKRQRRSRK